MAMVRRIQETKILMDRNAERSIERLAFEGMLNVEATAIS